MTRTRNMARQVSSSSAASHQKDDIRSTTGASLSKPKKGESAVIRKERWNYTSKPLTDEERRKNGRKKERDLVSWNSM